MNGGELKMHVTLDGKHLGMKLQGDILILKWIPAMKGESGRTGFKQGCKEWFRALVKNFCRSPGKGGPAKNLYTNWKGSL